jgi:hypothetical protein
MAFVRSQGLQRCVERLAVRQPPAPGAGMLVVGLTQLLLALAACSAGGQDLVAASEAEAFAAVQARELPAGQSAAAGGAADSAAGAATPSAGPVPTVFNASAGARPGDIVGIQGEDFGASPSAWLEAVGTTPATPLEIVNRVGSGWVAVQIPNTGTGALVLRIANGSATSAPVRLNGAVPHHLDATELAPGGAFRVFGRSLRLPGSVPTVTVDGLPAAVDVAASDEHMLVVTAPSGLRATSAAAIVVDNGNGTGPAALDRRIAVATGASGDPFGLGVGWGAAFAPLLSQRIDAATDTRLPARVRCDGVTDDAPALRAALVLVQRSGGGVLTLPAGTCVLGSGVQLFDRTVLEGAGKDRTELRHATESALYTDRADLVALRDLALTYASTGATSGLNLKNSRRVAVQRVRVNVGATAMAWLYGITNLVVVDSEFLASGSGRAPGALHLTSNTGVHVAGNRIAFFDGIGTNLDRTSDAYVAGNSWVRDADRQGQANVVHVVTVNFAHRIAIVGNTFDTLGRPIDWRRNDGETILTEGGGPTRTEGLGRVARAGRTDLTDPLGRVHPNVPVAGALPENFGIAIVAGKGAGQSRRVLAFANGTFTVDPPWDVVPDATSRYATALWGLERALVKGNELRNHPRGIFLYSTAVREVDIVGNRLEDNGGILVRAFQNVAEQAFTPVFGVRVDGNTISNDAGRYPSHVAVHLANLDGQAFGTSHVGVEVRRNVLATTGTGIDWGTYLGHAGKEGYLARMNVEADTFVGDPLPRLLGTVMQDNTCIRCATAFWLGTGATGTVLAGNRTVDGGTLWMNAPTVRGAPGAAATAVQQP